MCSGNLEAVIFIETAESSDADGLQKMLPFNVFLIEYRSVRHLLC